MHDAGELTHHSPEEIRKHVRTYMIVFTALAVLTVITVAVTKFHFAPAIAITIALAIASLKGGLVAAYFMHLIGERALIFYALILTVVFFAVLMVVPIWTNGEMVVIR